MDAKTGKTLWYQPGVSGLCGMASPERSAASEDTSVLCYYDGGERVLTDEGNDYHSSKIMNGTWSAVGIDTTSGKTKWRHRLTNLEKYLDRPKTVGLLMAEEPMSILPLKGGDKSVDSEKGTVTPLEQAVGANLLCTIDRDEYFIYSATLGTGTPTDHKASG